MAWSNQEAVVADLSEWLSPVGKEDLLWRLDRNEMREMKQKIAMVLNEYS